MLNRKFLIDIGINIKKYSLIKRKHVIFHYQSHRAAWCNIHLVGNRSAIIHDPELYLKTNIQYFK